MPKKIKRITVNQAAAIFQRAKKKSGKKPLYLYNDQGIKMPVSSLKVGEHVAEVRFSIPSNFEDELFNRVVRDLKVAFSRLNDEKVMAHVKSQFKLESCGNTQADYHRIRDSIVNYLKFFAVF